MVIGLGCLAKRVVWIKFDLPMASRCHRYAPQMDLPSDLVAPFET